MVMPRLPNHVLLSIKDQLRNARYLVRQGATGTDRRERPPFDLPEPIASVADTFFTRAEAAAAALLSDVKAETGGGAFPLPVDAYFGHPDEETAQDSLFTHVVYGAFGKMLRKFGARRFLVFEEPIENARSALLVRHRDLVWSAISAKEDAQRQEAVTRLCAAIVCALSAQRPIKELDIDPGGRSIPRHLLVAPNAYCALVVGLATAVASLKRNLDEFDEEAIAAAADMAVDARFPKFSVALRGRDPLAALTREFSAVLPFLP
jgi:hypothetical protein